MHITDIQFEKVSFSFEQPMKVAFAEIKDIETLLVKIDTDEGLSGFGEAAPLPFVTGDNLDSAWAVGRELRKALLGCDPAAIGGIHRRMDSLYNGCGAIKCAIDMACYDIAAKAAGMPLYRYLGGESGHVHSDVTIGIDTPDAMAAKALEWIEKGFTILKIKLGEDIETDLARMQAVRKAAGPSIALRIDANQGWTVKDSLRVIPELEKLNVGLIEQPVAAWNYEGLREIRQAVRLPIAAYESCHTPVDAARLASMLAVDFINIKLMKCGGIYNAIKINAVAESFGVSCMIGCMGESALANVAGMHVAAALDNIKEVDLDAVYILSDKKAHGGFEHKGGRAVLTDTPGIGVTID